MHFYGRNAKPSAQIEVKNSLRKRPLSLLSEVQPSGPNASSPGSYKPAAMAKRKHKKITPADEPEPGTRRSPRRAPTAGQRAAPAPFRERVETRRARAIDERPTSRSRVGVVPSRACSECPIILGERMYSI